ncbi:MAG: Na+/H+ antiporter NhaA [Bacteroidales bacterium]|nr:Na+/H+ antiporter NhaA [Bacteroidales bacterium]
MALIPIYWWNKEVRNFRVSQDKFTKQPWANGVILLACVVLAMLLANLPFTKQIYQDFLHTELTIHVASPDSVIDWYFPHGMTMERFINDILMVIFFFTVGLEIKREVVCGELSSPKKAILPVIAAFGGVLVPALIYTLVNHGTQAASGWGIPTATDIAFAIGILSILGDKVPVSLKVFLTALAIADDLIAILVVAIFYGGKINFTLLGIAVIVIVFVFLLKRLGEKRISYYFVPAVLVWFLFYYSGVHATMTGVVMAMLIPMEARYNKAKFHRRNRILWEKLIESENAQTNEPFPNGPQRHYLRHLYGLTKKTIPPSYRLEHKLNPIVNYAIMPVFALANAGVEISDVSLLNIFKAVDPVIGSVGLGVFLGLVLGKPIGITLASWLAIRFKVGAMPSKASWPMIFAVACLGGIGFTMSIFVDTLSFGGADPAVTQHLRDAGKMAVLLGSVASGLLGSLLITVVSKLKKPTI